MATNFSLSGPLPGIFLALLSILLTTGSSAAQKNRFRLPNQLREVSGLYIAGKDSLWWHNDGGKPPALFLTDSKGTLLKKRDLPGVKNRDWEDITADPSGNIYIGDFGNNANKRRDLNIYILYPDDRVDSIAFRYPDQQGFPPPPAGANFDMEAFFWCNDTLHLFSKNRLLKGNYYTKHYRLPAKPGVCTAALEDSLFLKKRVVTGAAISPDGKKIGLIAYHYKRFLGFIPTSAASVFLLDNFRGTHFLAGRLRKVKLACLLATQYESIDFEDNETLLVASERTVIIPQRARRIHLKN